MKSMLSLISSSNATQIAISILFGGLMYFCASFKQKIIDISIIFVFFMIIVSFLLDIGEVYRYSGIYKRAYWYFGDDITTIISVFAIYYVIAEKKYMVFLAILSMFLSGGKVAILLLFIQYSLILFLHKSNRVNVSYLFWKNIFLSLVAYFFLIAASPAAIWVGSQSLESFSASHKEIHLEQTKRGRGNCPDLESCFETNIKRPFFTRAYGAVAGLWMTQKGGYSGSRFPNTAEKFADLMIEENPWGINDRYQISREDWRTIGTIQTPYLQFGAGYGPSYLTALLFGIAVACVVGIWNLVRNERSAGDAFTVFFIVNAIFNQSQPWLIPGPLLMLVGFCGTNILCEAFGYRRFHRGDEKSM